MLTTIQDAVKQYLPAKRKSTANGWTSFNAVCCEHNGENRDTRGRGGVISNADGSISYSCFNCGFKANYTPGRHLNVKFRKLLSWLGADENSIKRLVIDAIRIKDLISPEQIKQTADEEVTFKPRPLPEDAQEFTKLATFYSLGNQGHYENVPEEFHEAISYVFGRKIDMAKYDFYWSPSTDYNIHQRVIVPFIWKGEIIGYTGRTFKDGVKPKYHNSHEPNFVFNMDQQTSDKQFVLVHEGPFDAMALDGVGVLSNECNEIQADIIDSLGREVIVVPDFDLKEVKGKQVWAGEKLVEQALEYGWSVSFPVWRDECKDVSAAVQRYGKLFTMKAILEGKQSSRLKIELMRKRIHS